MLIDSSVAVALEASLPASVRPSHPLSARGREVLRLVAAGQSNKLIARLLGVSPHTVKHHITNVFGKLDIARRSQAAAWYYLHPESSGCCPRPH